MVMCVESSAFGSLTLGAIVGNCMLMAVQGPPGSAEAMFGAREYEHLELGFTIFFSAELLLKTLAMGFYGHEHAFLSDPWNRLDLGIVLLGWLPIFFPALNTKYCAARPSATTRSRSVSGDRLTRGSEALHCGFAGYYIVDRGHASYKNEPPHLSMRMLLSTAFWMHCSISFIGTRAIVTSRVAP